MWDNHILLCPSPLFAREYHSAVTSEISDTVIISELQLIRVIEIPPRRYPDAPEFFATEVNVGYGELVLVIDTDLLVPGPVDSKYPRCNDRDDEQDSHQAEEANQYFPKHDSYSLGLVESRRVSS